MTLFRKKTPPPIPYNRAAQEPAVRSSICTGEMTLGFLDRQTGRFHEYELARSQSDVEAFCRRVGVEPKDIKRIY
ncbi:MAG: aspartate dehydrogenase [Oscillospiraceae bacterium]|nr:aspartate dehydrogenase [Oscillospiraceae bacterium]